ncbi:MAG: hypothetical protein NZL83_01680 [Candidatus Absconditabacterales bacterium]|nr:hypothetical protein [Candidatus Absconditabacterales bacterium]
MTIFFLLLLMILSLSHTSASFCLSNTQEQTLIRFQTRLRDNATSLDRLAGTNTNAHAQALLLRYAFEAKINAWLSCEEPFSTRDLSRHLRTYITGLKRLSKQAFSDAQVMMYIDDLTTAVQGYSIKPSLSLTLNHETMGSITANLTAIFSCDTNTNCELGRDAYAQNTIRGEGRLQSIIRSIDGTMWGTLREAFYTSGLIDQQIVSSTINSLTPLIDKRILIGNETDDTTTYIAALHQRSIDMQKPLPIMEIKEINGTTYANPHPAICERLPLMMQTDCKHTIIAMNRDLGQQGMFVVSQTATHRRYSLNPTLISGNDQKLSLEIDNNNNLTRFDLSHEEITISYQAQKSLRIITPTMIMNGRFVSLSPTTTQRRGTLIADGTSSPRTRVIKKEEEKTTLTFSLALPAIEGKIKNGRLDVSVIREPFSNTITKPTNVLTIQEAEALMKE